MKITFYDFRRAISIQALYDYKSETDQIKAKAEKEFQFKHCTIISFYALFLRNLYVISIQALYDYKIIQGG